MSDLAKRLREEARQEEAAHKMLADAKTARQTDREDAWADAGYGWLKAEQTSRWLAADRIEALESENGKLRAAISWIEPPFVTNTDGAEMRMRIKFCVNDAKRATLNRSHGDDNG